MDIIVYSNRRRKEISSPDTLGHEYKKAVEFERMFARSKGSWRSHWLLGGTAIHGFRHCNFITLPGPELLDVKALMSGDFRLHSVTMVEKKLSHISRIYKNLYDLDKGFDTLSQQEQRDLAAFNLGLLNNLDPIVKPSFTLLQGRFEDLHLDKIKDVFQERLKQQPTIICLDFCGVYLHEQHWAIAHFLKMLKDVKVLKGQRVFLILNFCTFGTTKANLGDELISLDTLAESVKHEGVSKHRCSTCYDSSLHAINSFGEFLERIPWELKEATKEYGLEIKEAMPPTHYQNGYRNRVGYTTHGFVYYN